MDKTTIMQTSRNYTCGQASYEKVSEKPSLTAPDMSYTVRQLLERFTTGIAPEVQRNGVYDENANHDNYDVTRDGDFDLADATAMKIELEARHNKRMEELSKLEKLKADAKKKQMQKFKEWEEAQAEKEQENVNEETLDETK